ncbi:hypothetical protein CIB95_09280 [Lottiidibacillus patelloidae]|uniref:Cytosine-specific methyltransferase n=1 Tax=Lottiidibacillus patelloidae TaxID=2670334 RepID=A0A263BTR9_9BACI|nr:DNA cytosine methyltransferase [Lottiidibacillus patelloidae]OZM56952.1 hypothetical protein CIB95_09280 [Lottiidibacillus patelloidae]
MRVISLFSGAGGMDLGFLLAGHEIVWANDFDSAAVETYKYNLEDQNNNKTHITCGDISTLLPNDYAELNKMIPDGDIVIGGFPCQGFSIANVDRNMEDERNYLYLELLRVIEAKNAPFFLLENVKGLENIEKGKVLEMILTDLELTGTKLGGPGYTVYYNVLNSLDYGVPQSRERVIIYGVRNDLVESAKLSLLDNTLHNAPYRKKLLVRPTHSSEGELINDISPHNKIDILYNSWKNDIPIDKDNIILPSYDKPIKHTTLRDAISDLPTDYIHKEDDGIDGLYNHYGTKCKVSLNNRVGNRPTFWEKHSPTIMGRGSGTGGPLIIPHPNAHRRMSIREVARIQTFPDSFIFIGSNSACYRQIGNAVPVLMAYQIARQLFPLRIDIDSNQMIEQEYVEV